MDELSESSGDVYVLGRHLGRLWPRRIADYRQVCNAGVVLLGGFFSAIVRCAEPMMADETDNVAALATGIRV